MNEILCLENGRVSEKGTYQDLMQKPDSAFKDFVNSFLDDPEAEEEEEEAEEDEKMQVRRRRKSTWKEEEKDGKGGKLIKEEQPQEGKVGIRMYLKYLKSMG